MTAKQIRNERAKLERRSKKLEKEFEQLKKQCQHKEMEQTPNKLFKICVDCGYVDFNFRIRSRFA